MIKSTYKILLLAISILLIITSCQEEDNILEYTDDSFYRFAAESGSVGESDTEPVEVEVFYSVPGGGSGSVDFAVGGDLAEGTDYTVVNSSKSLSFNEGNGYKDVIKIQAIDNDDVSTSPRVITITLTNPSGGSAGFPGPDALNSTYALTIIEDDCPSDLAGTYTTVTNGKVGDGDGGQGDDYPEVTGMVTVTDLGGGNYEIDDMSAGMYAAIYGLDPVVVTIQDVCNDVTITSGADQYNDPFSGTGTVASDGSIIISWGNTWGDIGETVLTPQ